MEEPDKLISGIVAGDPQAQSDFCKRYADRVAARARRELYGLPSAASATEVACSVVRRVLQAMPEKDYDIETMEQLDAFVARVTINRVLNERKKWMRDKRRPVRVVSDEELISSGEFHLHFGDRGRILAESVLVEGRELMLTLEECRLTKDEAERLFARIDDWLEVNRKQPAAILELDDSRDCIHESSVLKGLVHDGVDPLVPMIISEALNTLDEKERNSLMMHLDGETKQSIAEKMGVSVPVVRFRIQDAVKKLRNLLE